MPVKTGSVVKLWFFLFLTMGIVHGKSAADSLSIIEKPVSIVLKTYLEKNTVPQNRSVNFHVELSWDGELSRYQIVKIPQPTLSNLQLKGSGSANRLDELENGHVRSTKTIMYQLQPVETGEAVIEGMVIHYRDTKTGMVESLKTQRVTIRITEPLADRKGQVKAIIYVVLLVVFVGTVIYFLAVFLKRRNSAGGGVGEVGTKEAVYLKRISQEIDPRGTNLRDVSLRLGKIFQEYLCDVFSIKSAEAAGEDICDQLKSAGLENNNLEKLKTFFDKMSLIKFGGATVEPMEFTELQNIVEGFLQAQQKKRQAENV